MDERKQKVLCVALVAVALVVVLGQWVAAQHAQSRRGNWDDLIARAHGGARAHGEGYGRGEPAHSAPSAQGMAAMLEAVLERLEVTPAQRKEFQPQRRVFEQRVAEIARDASVTNRERHNRTMQAWFTMIDGITPGLTPEQRDVLQRLQAMFRKRIEARNRRPA